MDRNSCVASRTRSRKFAKPPENPLALVLVNNEANDEEDAEKDIIVLDPSNSEDSEDVRVLYEEKLDSRKVKRIGKKVERRGRSSNPRRTVKKDEKKKGQGKMKEVVEKDKKRRGKKEEKNFKKTKKAVAREENLSEMKKGLNSKLKLPMKREHTRTTDEDSCSSRLAMETLTLANKASEKFLELYCREAHACAFLDDNFQLSHEKLALGAAKSNEFDFLSGPPTDWATIEEFARGMKQRQELAYQSGQQKATATEGPSKAKIFRRLKRRKTQIDMPTSSIPKFSPTESKSSPAAEGETSGETPLPSALATVSGLKLMSVLQNINVLSFGIISRRNTRQILKYLEKEEDADNKEPNDANATRGTSP